MLRYHHFKFDLIFNLKIYFFVQKKKLFTNSSRSSGVENKNKFKRHLELITQSRFNTAHDMKQFLPYPKYKFNFQF